MQLYEELLKEGNVEKILKIYIGFDPVETVSWHTLAHSIYSHSSLPVALVPVNIRNMTQFFRRERDVKQSNEFSFSRFLVPYMNDYSGYAVFMDCDMLIRSDISEIFEIAHQAQDKAVHVVKHTYKPRDDVKYLGNVQYQYPRKNWSSVMMWNCGHEKNKALTTDFVSKASGLDLHRFTWLEDDEIGELDVTWNWLVGEYADPPKNVKNVHWTNGGPYFDEYRDIDFADEWRHCFASMTRCDQTK